MIKLFSVVLELRPGILAVKHGVAYLNYHLISLPSMTPLFADSNDLGKVRLLLRFVGQNYAACRGFACFYLFYSNFLSNNGFSSFIPQSVFLVLLAI